MCTETINGSGFYDDVANIASSLSLSLTGSYNANLDGFGAPTCTSSFCLPPDVLFDTAAHAGYNPIEFNPDLPTLDAPTPTALASDSALFIPGLCGGDQPTCGATGQFPAGDYYDPSGTYTSVDVGPSVPEPSSMLLIAGGIFLLTTFRKVAHRRA